MLPICAFLNPAKFCAFHGYMLIAAKAGLGDNVQSVCCGSVISALQIP